MSLLRACEKLSWKIKGNALSISLDYKMALIQLRTTLKLPAIVPRKINKMATPGTAAPTPMNEGVSIAMLKNAELAHEGTATTL